MGLPQRHRLVMASSSLRSDDEPGRKKRTTVGYIKTIAGLLRGPSTAADNYVTLMSHTPRAVYRHKPLIYRSCVSKTQ